MMIVWENVHWQYNHASYNHHHILSHHISNHCRAVSFASLRSKSEQCVLISHSCRICSMVCGSSPHWQASFWKNPHRHMLSLVFATFAFALFSATHCLGRSAPGGSASLGRGRAAFLPWSDLFHIAILNVSLGMSSHLTLVKLFLDVNLVATSWCPCMGWRGSLSCFSLWGRVVNLHVVPLLICTD